MHYALEGGGKRLRPLLAWQSYAFYAGEKARWAEALPLLHAIELLHTFTLVHDDVMDRSELRRGRPTLYRQTDSHTAILVGDALLIAVYQALSRLAPQAQARVLPIFSQAALRVCHGQLRDLALMRLPGVAASLEAYREMITEKSGAVMGGALEAGAALAGAEPTEGLRLRAAGEALGRFFQVQDDYLDAFGEQTGKVRGGDIVEGKKTFLWLRAYELATPEDRAWLENPGIPPEEKRRQGLELYERLGLRDWGKAYVEETLEEVRQAAAQVRMGEQVVQVAESLLERQF
jgi:geranylgeranyl diphosphate synthase type II